MTVVLSDLDGVLVDSQASIMRAWRSWGARHGLEVEAVEHGRPSGEIVAALAPGLDAAEESRALDALQAADTGDVVALPGAAELLRAFGPDRVAVVTSCTAALAEARLRSAGLEPPRVVVTVDRLRRGKPDPEGYLLAARELGADPAECVVLEDAPAGVEAGRAAGMRVVALVTTHDAEELAAADERVASVAEWLARADGGVGGVSAISSPPAPRRRPAPAPRRAR